VVASNSGGLEEAKRGTGYAIPVKTIERFVASRASPKIWARLPTGGLRFY